MSLNDALESLLYRTSERDAFLAGDTARFGLSKDDEDALLTIDKEQLATAALLTRKHVMERSHRGSGSIRDMFSETIAAWHADPDALAEAFVGSVPFAAYKNHAHSGQGISLEEAFYRFAEESSLGTPEVRRRELVFGILCGLVATPEPTFALPEMIRRAPKGYYAVLTEGPTLMALLDGKFMRGVVTPLIAALLTGLPLPETPERHTVAQELAKLGLL